jgi:hypothetical protein
MDETSTEVRRGGETPLVDFRAVATALRDTNVGRRFEEKRGVRYIRHYFDARSPFWSFAHRWDPLKTKSWQDMFKTNDWLTADTKAVSEGFTATWSKSKTTDSKTIRMLKLTHRMPTTIRHPKSNDEIWHNHLSVLHAKATADECAFSAQWLSSWYFVLQHWWFRALIAVQTKLNEFTYGKGNGTEFLGQHTTFGDGDEINDAERAAVRRAVWQNTIASPHQQSDVVLLDNMRIGHARQPFVGDRRILTTWA